MGKKDNCIEGDKAKLTICQFKEKYKKCTRKAVSSFKGKPFCNQHLQKLRQLEFENINYEKMEDFKK